MTLPIAVQTSYSMILYHIFIRNIYLHLNDLGLPIPKEERKDYIIRIHNLGKLYLMI